jgi:undecaprenyl-phosphate 4-deoxy-4-formamido-L-arabinose transferase
LKVSIIIPVYNEENGLSTLFERLKEIITKTESEIIFVNDGSQDNSLKRLIEGTKDLSRTKVIDLQGNFGQNVAVIAGFTEATNEHVMAIDADLQNDPQDIITLIKSFPEEADMFCGIRSKRKDVAWRVVLSRIFNFILTLFMGKSSNDIGCPMRILKRDLALQAAKYQNRYLFYTVPVTLLSKNTGKIIIPHRIRKAGKSNYNFIKLVRSAAYIFVFVFKYRSGKAKPVSFPKYKIAAIYGNK